MILSSFGGHAPSDPRDPPLNITYPHTPKCLITRERPDTYREVAPPTRADGWRRTSPLQRRPEGVSRRRAALSRSPGRRC